MKISVFDRLIDLEQRLINDQFDARREVSELSVPHHPLYTLSFHHSAQLLPVPTQLPKMR